MYKEFYLGAVKWSIEYCDTIEGEYFGMCENSYNRITLATKALNGKNKNDLSKYLIENTLFHEIQHAIMFTLGITDKDSLVHDEISVQSISNCWHNVFKTLK